MKNCKSLPLYCEGNTLFNDKRNTVLFALRRNCKIVNDVVTILLYYRDFKLVFRFFYTGSWVKNVLQQYKDSKYFPYPFGLEAIFVLT